MENPQLGEAQVVALAESLITTNLPSGRISKAAPMPPYSQTTQISTLLESFKPLVQRTKEQAKAKGTPNTRLAAPHQH